MTSKIIDSIHEITYQIHHFYVIFAKIPRRKNLAGLTLIKIKICETNFAKQITKISQESMFLKLNLK